jgi:hypothetical protein
MNTHSMTADEVIGLIPDNILDSISTTTKADYKVSKLAGKVLLKLFLYTALSASRISLRIMETIYASEKFRRLFSIDPNTQVSHSGLGKRLSQITPDYFKNIFSYLAASQPLGETISFGSKRIHLRKLDSTFLTISEKLISYGMQQNKGQKELKVTVELGSGIPVNVLLFTDQSEIIDYHTFPKLLKERAQKKALNIAIFDRGCESSKQFIQLKEQGIFFITRISRVHPKVLEDLSLAGNTQTETLTILSDQRVEVRDVKTMQVDRFRLVTGQSKKTKEVIKFLTDVDFLTAAEITELYKSRWEMETFFKFVKQELNFSHLLSRSRNGVTNVMHLTMIAAILLMIYKKTNKLVGWVVVKIKFLDELESWVREEWEKSIILEKYGQHFQLIPNLSG